MGESDNKVNESAAPSEQKGSENNKRARPKERIDRLEKDLEELRTTVEGSSVEVKTAVEDLRSAVVDIRSAVSEIENPFNLLRVITNEKDISKIKEAQPAIRKVLSKESGGTELEESDLEETGAPEPVRDRSIDRLTFKDGTSLVRWIYGMLDLGFDAEALKRMCDYCEYVGVIPAGSSPHLSNMIDTISGLKSKGLFEEEVILGMYTAAEAAEVKVEGYRVGEALIQFVRRNKSKKVVS